MTGHEVITFNTQHHRQPFRKQRGIQLDSVHWQLVGYELFAGILITSHEEQLGAYIIKGMEISCPAQHLSHHFIGLLNKLLREIGQQLVAVIKAIGHVERQVLPASLLIAISRVGIDIGTLTAIKRIDGSVSFSILTKASLSLDETVQPIGRLHVDIQHITRTNSTLGNARIVAHLNLLNVLGLHLTENQSVVAIERDIVNAEIVKSDNFFIVRNQQVRHHLQDIHQRLFTRQFHPLRIDHRPVCPYLYDRQTIVCKHRG